LYDAAKEIVMPHCPPGSVLSCDKGRGILQVVALRRYHTLVQIEPDEFDPQCFKIVERKKTMFILPSYITQDMISAVIQKGKEEPCFL